MILIVIFDNFHIVSQALDFGKRKKISVVFGVKLLQYNRICDIFADHIKKYFIFNEMFLSLNIKLFFSPKVA